MSLQLVFAALSWKHHHKRAPALPQDGVQDGSGDFKLVVPEQPPAQCGEVIRVVKQLPEIL